MSGPDRDRTDDLLNAIQALSQLSYGPLLEHRKSSQGRKLALERLGVNSRLVDPIAGPCEGKGTRWDWPIRRSILPFRETKLGNSSQAANVDQGRVCFANIVVL